jgi:hypothetical protein
MNKVYLLSLLLLFALVFRLWRKEDAAYQRR